MGGWIYVCLFREAIYERACTIQEAATWKSAITTKNGLWYSFFLHYLTSTIVGLTPLGTYNSNAHGSVATNFEWNTRHIHKDCLPWMCGQHNVRVTARDNTGQNTDKGHTTSPRIEIKISESAGNWTRASGLEGRDCTDHVATTDSVIFSAKVISLNIRMSTVDRLRAWYDYSTCRP